MSADEVSLTPDLAERLRVLAETAGSTPTQHPAPNSSARKRNQPDTDPIAAVRALIYAAEKKDGRVPACALRVALGMPRRTRGTDDE